MSTEIHNEHLTPENYLNNVERRSRIFPDSPGDELVISGVSGHFPSSDNVQEFSKNLYNKIDMITDKEARWSHSLTQELPRRKGVINDLTKFDATFFGIHNRQANAMDPQGRQLIECAYEAILDSGTHPMALRGTKCGVFIAVCFSETEKTLLFDQINADGFSLPGCSRAMIANRISYSLGLNGPSYTVDTACSSSMYALDCAFNALRTGQCDSALVCGTNLLLHPYTTLNFLRLGVLSSDGYCRPFDKNASGYTRAESICAMFLQKSKDAKRVYGKLIYSNTNCDGYKPEGILFPSQMMQEKLLSDFYKDLSIDPATVAYVEAHGTGTRAGDPEECKTLDHIFCANRKEPLLIGSVKSSIGHSEACSGLCSITKVLLAFETGLISPNINFTEMRSDIPALVDGRLKVCLENTPLAGDLIAVNSFGFGGANAHVLLARNSKEKINNGAPNDSVPRLILWAGRTEEACDAIFNQIESNPLDTEYVGLLHELQKYEVPGNLYRGYAVFKYEGNGENAACITRSTKHFDAVKRPIVWMFTGMGSQWVGMGTSLMQIDIFKQSIERSHKVLEPFGLNLISIITSTNSNTFDHIINSFVGIAAIQIALVDILRELQLPMDYCIGHSVGELGCAYADNTLTAEQMLLSAYYRGLVSQNTKVIVGSMAAIGLSYSKVKDLVPNTIEIACHNSCDSATLSGPQKDVTEFVEKLKKDNIFAKEVQCSNIPYHSKYIAEMGPKLLAKLKEFIPCPKKRSNKWLSTSVNKNEWNSEKNQFSSAEYHTNNLLSPVLFEETCKYLPEDALTIEIAPHGLLQAIIKKALPNGIHIPLTQRANKDNTSFFLTALGKLFFNGILMPIERLYPTINYPVSRGTAMIAPYIKWDHTQEYFVAEYSVKVAEITSERKVAINLVDEDYEYMSGHIIDGRCLLPATSYLQLVRETLIFMTPGQNFNGVSIEFENIKFMRATTLSTATVNLTIVIHSGSGQFEISENTTTIVSGIVRCIKEPYSITEVPEYTNSTQPTLNSREFYKELRLRGYNYAGIFKSVVEARADGTAGKVKWIDNNWAAFMDCLLQVNILALDTRSLCLPTSIRKIRINTEKHLQMVADLDPENPVFDVKMSKELQTVVCGGIEVTGLLAMSVSRRKPPGHEVLEVYDFIPLNGESTEYSKEDAASILLQIGQENILQQKIKIIEVLNGIQQPIIQFFDQALENTPLVVAEMLLLSENKHEDLGHIIVENSRLESYTNCHYIISSNVVNNKEFAAQAVSTLNENGFIISREPPSTAWNDINVPDGFQLVSLLKTSDETFVLLQLIKKSMPETKAIVEVKSEDTEFEWLTPLREAIKTGHTLAVNEKENFSGLIGLTNCIRREPGGNKLQCIQIDDKTAPSFVLDHPLYETQLQLGLAVNVLRNGSWGTYRHIRLSENKTEEAQNGHCYVSQVRPGDMTSLTWMTGWLKESNEKLVYIQYAGLNFRDVMFITGRITPEAYTAKPLRNNPSYIGMEYAGVTASGNRVMGMKPFGALATLTEGDYEVQWRVPDHWSLREAATVPVVYLTVYYAYFLFCPVSKGQSILIHAGSGGIGLAAIRIAFSYGLEVFTTVSTPQKKQYIMNLFPQLKESNIGNSRDCSFENLVMQRTNGNGVNYVLNSLSEDKLMASIRCLGFGGVFLEIGKFDILNNSNLGMNVFSKELTFRAVFADNLLRRPKEECKFIYDRVQADIDNGIIQPLDSTMFRVDEVEKAYRYMSTGKHIGKVVIQLRETENSPKSLPMTILQRIYNDPKAVFLIVGGLGGFGLELADWLVLRGARILVLSSRRGITTGYQAYRIRTWESYGCKVIISTSDVTQWQGARALLMESLGYGPIAGIFNLAVILRDAIFENQTAETFLESFMPKAVATRYLDQLSRVLCPNLKHFVIFSSASCGRGNAGQSNYGMANSIMERIIERRCSDGLPGKAIQWGAIGEVGLVAEMAQDKIDLEIVGTVQQRIAACMNVLDTLLTVSNPIVSSMVVAQKHLGIKMNIIESVLYILGIRDLKSVSKNTTLAELGMDSLMAVEIKQTLEREFDINLTAADLRGLTFAKLQEISDSMKKDDTIKSISSDADDLSNASRPQMFNTLGEEKTCNQVILPLNKFDQFDKCDACALFIPGIEGVAGPVLFKLGKLVNMPSYALQIHSAWDKTTLDDIINFVSKDVLDLFKSKKYFVLIGHSFGSAIAIELAKLLEKNGLHGKIVSLDGSMLLLKRFVTSLLREQDPTDDMIQMLLMQQIAFEMTPDIHFDTIQSMIDEGMTFDEKASKFIDIVQKNDYSADYLKKFGHALFNRFRIFLNLNVEKTDKKIEANILLIRPTIKLVPDIDDNYELSKFTNGTVAVSYVDGNHLTMLEDAKLHQTITEICN